MGCKVNQIINPFGFVGARVANGVLKNDTNIELCSPFPPVLNIPTNVVVTNVDENTLNVSFVQNNIGATYIIERGTDNVSFSVIGNTSSNNFNDSTAVLYTKYYYRVIATSEGVDSSPSESDYGATVKDYSSFEYVFEMMSLVETTNPYWGRIRRSSDDATALWIKPKIGMFISLNDMTDQGVSVGDWVGSDDAFIQNIINQGTQDPSTTLLEQTTLPEQPRIITSGVVDDFQGTPMPTYNYSGSFSRLTSLNYGDNPVGYYPNTFDNFILARDTDATNNITILMQQGANDAFRVWSDRRSGEQLQVAISPVATESLYLMDQERDNSDLILRTISADGAQASVWTNGNDGTQNQAYNSYSNGSLTVGSRAGGSNDLEGSIPVVILKSGNLGVDRASYDADIQLRYDGNHNNFADPFVPPVIPPLPVGTLPLPLGWDALDEGNNTLLSMIELTDSGVINGAHDCEFITVGDKAYSTYYVYNSGNEDPNNFAIRCELSIIDLSGATPQFEQRIAIAESEQVFGNVTLPQCSVYTPKPLQIDANTIRVFFVISNPGTFDNLYYYRDFNINTENFDANIYTCDITSGLGTKAFNNTNVEEWMTNEGWAGSSSDHGLYLIDGHFKDLTGNGDLYAMISYYNAGRSIVVKLANDFKTFELIGWTNSYAVESSITRLPDNTYIAIGRQANNLDNYKFATSADLITWTNYAEDNAIIPDGTNSKPFIERYGDCWYIGYQLDTEVAGVFRSKFHILVTNDWVTFENWADFETTNSFQYPAMRFYNDQAYINVTQGQKERIMFGKMNTQIFNG